MNKLFNKLVNNKVKNKAEIASLFFLFKGANNERKNRK